MCMANTWNSWSARQEGQRGTVSVQQQKKIFQKKYSQCCWPEGVTVWFRLKKSKREENRSSQTQTRLLCGQASPVYCQTNGTWKRPWHILTIFCVQLWVWDEHLTLLTGFIGFKALLDTGWKVKCEKALMQLHGPLVLVNWKALLFLFIMSL